MKKVVLGALTMTMLVGFNLDAARAAIVIKGCQCGFCICGNVIVPACTGGPVTA